jgi:hypothetical protein
MTTGDVIGIGGNGARVHQTGMRSDDGAGVVDGLVDPGLFEIRVEVQYQSRRIVWIPRAGDRGAPQSAHFTKILAVPVDWWLVGT